MGFYYLWRGKWNLILIFYSRKTINKAMTLFNNIEVNTTEIAKQVKNGCF